MKPLLALAAFVVATVAIVPTAEAGRSVARSKQVVRGRGHAAAAQVVCAPQLQLVAPQAQVFCAPQAQVFYPAPQQVFLPQVAQVYAQPQVVVQPQMVYPPAAAQVVLPQQINYGAQAQIVDGGRVRFKQKFRGNAAAAQALVLPY